MRSGTSGSPPKGDRGDAYRAEEKGIDVLLAIGLVMGAMRDEYDVAVVFSGDSDLLPAIEAVLSIGKRCEVAAWRGRSARSPRLRPSAASVWCHWLDERAYEVARDPRDYTEPGPPKAARPTHGGR